MSKSSGGTISSSQRPSVSDERQENQDNMENLRGARSFLLLEDNGSSHRCSLREALAEGCLCFNMLVKV